MEKLFQQVVPLNQKLLLDTLARLEMVYFIDSAGDVGMFYEECIIWFNFLGDAQEQLIMYADPFRDVPFDELAKLREFINEWNREALWPRVSPTINDRGFLRARCDYFINGGAGITPVQLAEQIKLFLTVVEDFYLQLDQTRKAGWK